MARAREEDVDVLLVDRRLQNKEGLMEELCQDRASTPQTNTSSAPA